VLDAVEQHREKARVPSHALALREEHEPDHERDHRAHEGRPRAHRELADVVAHVVPVEVRRAHSLGPRRFELPALHEHRDDERVHGREERVEAAMSSAPSCCGLVRVTALSCEGRGFCPRRCGRRLTERARHLAQRVLPEGVRVQQWVLSLRFDLRWRKRTSSPRLASGAGLGCGSISGCTARSPASTPA
jgi:hypothetical protein